MLVLQRKANEAIVIGDNVVVKVNKIEGNRVWLAIDAPRSVTIHRDEIAERIKEKQKAEVSNV